jgi:hypothetical protein
MIEGRAKENFARPFKSSPGVNVDPPLGGQRLEELAQMPTWIATTSSAFDGEALHLPSALPKLRTRSQ